MRHSSPNRLSDRLGRRFRSVNADLRGSNPGLAINRLIQDDFRCAARPGDDSFHRYRERAVDNRESRLVAAAGRRWHARAPTGGDRTRRGGSDGVPSALVRVGRSSPHGGCSDRSAGCPSSSPCPAADRPPYGPFAPISTRSATVRSHRSGTRRLPKSRSSRRSCHGQASGRGKSIPSFCPLGWTVEPSIVLTVCFAMLVRRRRRAMTAISAAMVGPVAIGRSRRGWRATRAAR